jgi:hypothetical protein
MQLIDHILYNLVRMRYQYVVLKSSASSSRCRVRSEMTDRLVIQFRSRCKAQPPALQHSALEYWDNATMANSATSISRLIIPHLTRSTRTFTHPAFGATTVRGAHSASSERSRPLAICARLEAQQWQRDTRRGHERRAGFRRDFSATAVQAKDHHFDTLKFVQRLREEGFSEEQSVAMMRVMSDVIEERYALLALLPILLEY